MKNLHTEIIYILDRSGSMEPLRDTAIEAFNQLLREQAAKPGLARLTLVQFDDEMEVPIKQIPIQEVLPLNHDTYVPRGCTALLDALGLTIDVTGTRLAELSEKDRPAQVIVAIYTDGLENASEDYTLKQVAEKIRHQEKKYNWTFLFLGANQDAIATAALMGIDSKNAASSPATKAGVSSSLYASNRKIAALRDNIYGITNPDVEMSLSDIVEEEAEKLKNNTKPNP